jgi:hypothetical protein
MSFTGYLTPNQFFHPEFHRVSHTQPVFPPWVSQGVSHPTSLFTLSFTGCLTPN